MDLKQYEDQLVFEPYDEEKHGSIIGDLETGSILKLSSNELVLVGDVNRWTGQCDCCCAVGLDTTIVGVAHVKQITIWRENNDDRIK